MGSIDDLRDLVDVIGYFVPGPVELVA